MNTKICNRCKKAQELCQFRRHKSGKGGLYGICLSCESIQSKEIYGRPGKKQILKEWRDANRDRINESNRKSYNNNIELEREKSRIKRRKPENKVKQKTWRLNNIEHMRAYYREKPKIDPVFRACKNIRSRLFAFFKGKTHYFKELGCSKNEFQNHLESQFIPGMTWENYGEWHIDHKYPLSVAYKEGPESFKKACHYTNLQPLWAKDNQSKGNKV